ncbi:hypothetical protein [Streptomyces sp. SD15]
MRAARTVAARRLPPWQSPASSWPAPWHVLSEAEEAAQAKEAYTTA